LSPNSNIVVMFRDWFLY